MLLRRFEYLRFQGQFHFNCDKCQANQVHKRVREGYDNVPVFTTTAVVVAAPSVVGGGGGTSGERPATPRNNTSNVSAKVGG